MFVAQRSYLYKFVDRGILTISRLIWKPPFPLGILPENIDALAWLKNMGIPFEVLMRRDKSIGNSP